MKSLLLIRHAKSSWDNPLQKDFDRPLNERGKHDAPEMAKHLKKKKIEIDALISSPAKRALSTCKYFADAFKIKEKKIITASELYEPSVDAFYNVIINTDDKFNTIALFSHNPGITNFVNELTETRIDDVPTCSVYAVKTATVHWKEFKDAKKEFWFFEYPKMI